MLFIILHSATALNKHLTEGLAITFNMTYFYFFVFVISRVMKRRYKEFSLQMQKGEN